MQHKFYITAFPTKRGAKTVNTGDVHELTFEEIRELIKIYAESNAFYDRKKIDLPYTTTSHMEVGKFASQKGNHSLLFLDVDDFTTRKKVEQKLKKYNYISYNSYNHGLKTGNRFRLIIELDRYYSASDFKLMKKELTIIFPFADKVSFDSNRPMYLPVKYDGKRNPLIYNNEGTTYSLEEILKNSIKEETEKKIIQRSRIFKKKEGTIIDVAKQRNAINKAHKTLSNKSVGETHIELYKQALFLSYAGIDQQDIIEELSIYETTEHSGKVARDVYDINVEIDSWYYKTPNFTERYNSLINDEKFDTIQVENYVSEKKDYILNELTKSKKILLHADTNTGKTHLFTRLQEKVILFVPLVSIANQVYKSVSKTRHDICIVKEGFEPNYKSNLMICTYESIFKLENEEGRAWLKDAIFVVDEAHNLTISADYNYRQKSISSLVDYKDFASKVVYMSGSPVFDSNLTNFKIIRIKKKTPRKKQLKLIIYDNKISSVVDTIKNTKGQHLIYNDNKKQNDLFAKLLTDLGYTVKIISSNTKHDEFVQTGILDKSIDIVISTKVLGEGFRFFTNLSALHVLKETSQEVIYQFSERPNDKAFPIVFLYKSHLKHSKDRNFHNKTKYKQELRKYARDLLTNSSTLDLEKLQKLSFGNEARQKIKARKTIDNVIHAMIDDKETNLWKFNEYKNEFELNELGINFCVHKKETNFNWNNIEYLIHNLITKYDFVFDVEQDIIQIKKTSNRIKNLLKKLKKEQQQSEQQLFEGVLYGISLAISDNQNRLLYDENTSDFAVFKNKIIKRFNSLNDIYKDAKKTLDILYSFGVQTERKFNRLVLSEEINKYKKHNDIASDIKNIFKIDSEFTPTEQLIIIKRLLRKYKLMSEWRINNLSLIQSSFFLQNFVEVKLHEKRVNGKVTRFTKIISFDSKYNYITEHKTFDVTETSSSYSIKSSNINKKENYHVEKGLNVEDVKRMLLNHLPQQ